MIAKEQDSAPGPLRILMTTDAVGGVWQYSLDLSQQLTQAGFKILLATLGPSPSRAQQLQAKSIPGLTLAEAAYGLEWMPGAWADVDASGKWLLDLQSTFDADVIHLNGYSHAVLPWKKPVLVTAHSCVRSWWRAVHGCAPDGDWDEYTARVRKGLNACDRVVAPSTHMADCIRDEYGVPQEKISVIRNFSHTAPASRIPKAPFILAAGRIWDPAKNLAMLDEIAGELDWDICIAGSAQQQERGAAGFCNCTCLGALPHSDMLEQMASAAIFAHPALYEPFGLAVLEAARARCCLVLSDIPSLRELWDGAAVFLPPRDAQRWKHELNALARDSRRRADLGERAQAHAAQYTAHASVQEYIELYRALTGDTAAPAAKGAVA